MCDIDLSLRVSVLTISTPIKPVANDGGSCEEFELPDVTEDVDDDLLEPAPDLPDHSGGLLTAQSNTLGTATFDSSTEPVSDMEHFFDKYQNEKKETMRRCKACL